MRPASLEFLQKIIETASPSGAEHAVAQCYADYVAPFSDRVSRDVIGNTVAVLNEDGKVRILLAGHMDEISFIIHHIDERGFLFFSPVGGHDSAIDLGQRVWVHGTERVAGVVGRKAIHLMTPDELQKKPQFRTLWIDIGASSYDEASAVAAIGDVVTYQQSFQRLLGDFAVSRAFDNKAGLCIIADALRILKDDGGLHPDVAVYAVATVQEEIGSRGAQIAAFEINPHTAIAIDMGHGRDIPGLSVSEFGRLDLGAGPGIARGANTNPLVFDLMKSAAEKDSIPFQTTAAAGTTPTDANALQVSGRGSATGLLEVPLRYMHTPSEVLHLTDVENCARLLAAYCRAVTPDTQFSPGLRISQDDKRR
jgi:endoglucanase